MIAQSMNMPDQSYNFQSLSQSENVFQRMYFNNRVQIGGNIEQHSRNMNFYLENLPDKFREGTQSSFYNCLTAIFHAFKHTDSL